MISVSKETDPYSKAPLLHPARTIDGMATVAVKLQRSAIRDWAGALTVPLFFFERRGGGSTYQPKESLSGIKTIFFCVLAQVLRIM